MMDMMHMKLRIVENWKKWEYVDLTNEGWDTQPACYVTDYALALQCCAFLYLMHRKRDGHNGAHFHWYLTYFTTLAITGLIGGFMHHLANQVMHHVGEQAPTDVIQHVQLFGYHVAMTRAQVDEWLNFIWRLVLVTFTINNFALFSLAASRHFPKKRAQWTIAVSALGYLALIVWAILSMSSAVFIIGFGPVMFFGSVNVVYASCRGASWALGIEMLAYVMLLTSCLVQGQQLSPSVDFFDYNALGHVFVATGAAFVLSLFHADHKASRVASDTIKTTSPTTGLASGLKNLAVDNGVQQESV